MANVIETTVTVKKIVVELDLEEAKGLQDLLWYGVSGGALDKLNLSSLCHALYSYSDLRGDRRQFTKTAQL